MENLRMDAMGPDVWCDPLVDARHFRRCLGQFSTGVTVIAAEHDGVRVGVTANSFSSLSLDPPLVLWSIARTSRAFAAFAQAPRFAISILADDQVDVSQRFSSKAEDKFATIAWRPGANGAPLIEGSAAWLECTTEVIHEGGDHVLIVGRVTRFAQRDVGGLVFSRGRYSLAVDHPVLRPQAPADESGALPGASTFGTLVFAAHLAASHGFDARRAAAGMTIGEGRVLYGLSEFGPSDLDRLIRRCDLPRPVVEDALAGLAERGHVVKSVDGRYGLTEAGEERRATMRRRIAEYEAQALSGISTEDLATTRRVLEQFVAQNDAAR